MIDEIKKEAIKLRINGMTYSEISAKIGRKIPKSTLSYWCTNIKLNEVNKQRITALNKQNLEKARVKACESNKLKRLEYINSIKKRVQYLKNCLYNTENAKLVLAALYAAEGSKSSKGSVTFGNSDANIIKLFLRLLRYCFKVDENKFRCTLQCRADQDKNILENFWSFETGISLNQFYKVQVDPRSIGKKTKKLDYKGVCRINYLCSEVDLELKEIFNIMGP